MKVIKNQRRIINCWGIIYDISLLQSKKKEERKKIDNPFTNIWENENKKEHTNRRNSCEPKKIPQNLYNINNMKINNICNSKINMNSMAEPNYHSNLNSNSLENKEMKKDKSIIQKSQKEHLFANNMVDIHGNEKDRDI